MSTEVATAVILLAVAPVAIVLIIALMRGYTIDIQFRRRKRNDQNGE